MAIVDDEPGMRLLLTRLFETNGIACQAFASAEGLLDDVENQQYAVLVVDIRLRGMSGLQLQAELNRRNMDIEIAFVSGQATVADAICAFGNRAGAFFEKPFKNQELLESVQKLREKWIKRRTRLSAVESLLAPLSTREKEVMDALIAGKNTVQVARELNISPSTVEKHRLKIFEKTGVDSVIQLIHMTVV
ncbi:MAG: response regulator transcription factor [Pirellulales bacterium]